MNKIKNWYKEEVGIQFMLGNMWNDPIAQSLGRKTLIFNWIILIIGFTLSSLMILNILNFQ